MDIKALVKDILNNPEVILDPDKIPDSILEELNNELINKDIYKQQPELDRHVAAVSFTNIQEKYLRRLSMVSLVSFMFQMSHEYEIPIADLTWEQTQINEQIAIEDLENKIDLIKGTLTELKKTISLETEYKTMIAQMELLLDDTPANTSQSQSQSSAANANSPSFSSTPTNNDLDIAMADLYSINKKYAGLSYTIATLISDVGYEYNARLPFLIDNANKFGDLKTIIDTKKHKSSFKMPEINGKQIINNFLKLYLSYDPSIHVRASSNDVETLKKNIKFEESFNIDVPKKYPGVLNVILNNNRYINTVLTIVNNEDLLSIIPDVLQNIDIVTKDIISFLFDKNAKLSLVSRESGASQASLTPEQILVAPDDTFHRWAYYTEVNYEELRVMTEFLYPERSHTNFAIGIWDTFKGTTEEVNEQFNKFCQTNYKKLPGAAWQCDIGNWVTIASYKKNRENTNIYNPDNEIIKKIIDRHVEDEKIGQDLMRNRVRQSKMKNIAESGPDAPGLNAYKKTLMEQGKDLRQKGAEKVISPEEMKRYEKAKGSAKAAKELEVLDEYTSIKRTLEEIKKSRTFTDEEQSKYDFAIEKLRIANEMINVPDDAIQVDVFSTDTKTNTFNKTHFYTKCDEALSENVEK